ncbi:MAG TPA: hypothetical protein VHL53_19720 [Acidimicrobiia bacterium]|nr:hypothetical protein [Acidimicrobiia bacterium]
MAEPDVTLDRSPSAGPTAVMAATTVVAAVILVVTGSLVVPSFLVLAVGIRLFYGPRAASLAPLLACLITVAAAEGWRHLV